MSDLSGVSASNASQNSVGSWLSSAWDQAMHDAHAAASAGSDALHTAGQWAQTAGDTVSKAGNWLDKQVDNGLHAAADHSELTQTLHGAGQLADQAGYHEAGRWLNAAGDGVSTMQYNAGEAVVGAVKGVASMAYNLNPVGFMNAGLKQAGFSGIPGAPDADRITKPLANAITQAAKSAAPYAARYVEGDPTVMPELARKAADAAYDRYVKPFAENDPETGFKHVLGDAGTAGGIAATVVATDGLGELGVAGDGADALLSSSELAPKAAALPERGAPALTAETEAPLSAGAAPTGSTAGREIYGPHYEQAKQLHLENPDFFPDPDAPGTAVVSGTDLAAARSEYQAAVQAGDLPAGHHVQGLAFGGQNIPENLTFTGESTIRAAQLDGLDLSFYGKMGYGKPNAQVLKIYQETPDGIFRFGLNPAHTEATTFQNQVLSWQRAQGLR
jgi:hypothetical protein